MMRLPSRKRAAVISREKRRNALTARLSGAAIAREHIFEQWKLACPVQIPV